MSAIEAPEAGDRGVAEPGEYDGGAAELRYMYGVLPAPTADDVLTITGLAGRPIRLVCQDDLAVVVSDVDVDRPLGRREDLLAHWEVLNELAQSSPVIPMRFGTVVGSDEDIMHGVLLPNAVELRATLHNLTGMRQFNLRARYREEAVMAEIVAENEHIARLREQTRDVPEEQSMQARIRQGQLVAEALERKRQHDAHVLLDALSHHTVGQRVRESGDAEQILDVALLVAEQAMPEFEAAAEEIAADMHERATLRLLGPLAPFDFVEEW